METLAFLSGTVNVLIFIAALGFIIFIHELGHFAVAKWVGIRVDQFAVGFGKALLAWRKGIGVQVGTTEPIYYKKVIEALNGRMKDDPDFRQRYKIASSVEPAPIKSVEGLEKLDPAMVKEVTDELGLGETEYRLNYIPLGGYVKMLGQEDMDPTAVSNDPRAYNNKPIWARMCVISAGVIMNVITAVGFFIVAFMWGVDFPPAMVGDVDPNMPAAKAVAVDDDSVVGLRTGDRILSINGEAPRDFTEVMVAVALTKKDTAANVVVERPGLGGEPDRTLTFNITPKVDQQGFRSLGFTKPSTLKIVDADEKADAETVAEFADAINAPPGTTLVQVNGQPIDSAAQLEALVQASNGETVELGFEDAAGELTTRDYTPITSMTMVEVPVKNTDIKQAVPALLGLAPAVKIDGVIPGGPADGVLEDGDVVMAVGELEWPTSGEFIAIVQATRGEIAMRVLRDGEPMELAVNPRRKFLGILGDAQLRVGVGWAIDSTTVARVLDGSPFEQKGLIPGATIEAINGQAVADYSQVRRAVEADEDGVIEVKFLSPLAGGVEQTVEVTLDEPTQAILALQRWGLEIGGFELLKVPLKAETVGAAVAMGYDKTTIFLKQTYLTLARVLDGTVAAKHLSGPVGITDVGARMVNQGWSYLLWFMGLISVNLAVINFLPLPIVDGGHFVMLVIEKFRGKPLPLQVQSAITTVGLILLGTVFLYVTFNDIVRVVNKLFS